MAFSLYAATVPSYCQILGAVAGLVEKAEVYCKEKGLTPQDILQARLAADMQPFAYQVKSTVVHSLGAIEGVRKGVFCCPTNLQFPRLRSLNSPRVPTQRKIPMNALDARNSNGRVRRGTRCLSMPKPHALTAECSPLREAPDRRVEPGSQTCSSLLPPRQTAYPSTRETLPILTL